MDLAKKKQEQEMPLEEMQAANEEEAVEQENEQPEIEIESAEEAQEKDAAEVNDMLCALESERDEYKDALVRERADFENYKKRNADLAANSFNNGVVETVSAVLPVLDNFERALAMESADKAFVDGMAMIMRQLQDVLKALGVEEIDTQCKFDPNFHDAVMQCEDDGYESNDVVETLQKGYKLKDRILRHAMVKVNK